MTATSAREHFDEIASSYDGWKAKNDYYYRHLKALCQDYVPPRSRVVEIGCGTGDILVSLEPSSGLGIDVSAGMIDIARRKHRDRREVRFEVDDITHRRGAPFECDAIIVIDVIEHVDDHASFIAALARNAPPNCHLLLSMINPLWEPILLAAEKVGMKMPEGPHTRPTIRQTERCLAEAGWAIQKRGYRLPAPKQTPFSSWLNDRVARGSWPQWLGCVVFWHAVRDSR